MSRQQRFSLLPLVGTIFLSLLVSGYLMYLIAGKRSAKRKPAAAITKHSLDTNADATLKYWTAARMRDAKAAEMPHVDTPERGKQHP
jgi:hypothetical protein